MPHPEHAVEDLTGPCDRRPRLLHQRAEGGRRRVSVDTVEIAAKTPGRRAALGRARAQARRVPADPRHPRPPPHHRRAGDVQRHVERALLLQVVEGAPAPVRRPAARATRCWSASARTPAWSTSATATRSPSRSSRTTTRATSSPTRARPPASAASSATSSPWAPGPIAVMDSLRFGRADAPDTARVLPGVVAGVGGYGNCLGLPNIGGELLFDDCYAGNPLVNALCVGVMKHEDVRLAKAEGARQQGHPLRRAHRRRRHRRRQRAGSRDLRRRRARPSGRACRSATRSPRSC